MGPSAAQVTLRGLCGGAVHLPGDPAYDLARTAWNTAVDQRPAAVAYPADPAEVAALLRAARAVGLRVASQGTGHHADALGPLDDTILLRTAAMTGLSVDRAARRARVGAGMLWVDVVDAVSPLAALHPAAPDVGVVGFSLSGGLSWYGRALGLQSNAITAVELVTAGGDAVRADADHEADLFWALRGGGANFGVVTALEFALHPVPEVHAGLLAWDAARAERVLAAWVDWAASAPETVTTAARVMPAPGALTDLRGRQLLVVNGAVLGPAGAALAPLRGLRPEVDTFARVPAAALARLHLEPEGPRPDDGRESLALRQLDGAGVAALLAAAGTGGLELRHLGGALGRPLPTGGAVSHVDGAFLLVARPGSRGLFEAAAPYATGRRYLALTAGRGDVSAGYDPAAWPRLRAIRAAVDPDGLLVAGHPIPSAREVAPKRAPSRRQGPWPTV
ncbi:FAD-binding oxidoreductase [Luedemannella flava]|uniref:FAD-binding oxidoreductase n=1 Tax=Luedemannella flava TaxID=349316 RepID=A0ABP4Z3T2_9ACTN